jgi:replication-associated recombination protein RarA
MILKTKRGYDLSAVVSTLQKAMRRGDAKLAGFMAIEMFESGYAAYCWRRLLTVSAEDTWGIITQEIVALQMAYEQVNRGRPRKEGKAERGRIFLAKAVILLCEAKHSRAADHLTNYLYDRTMIDAKQLAEELANAEPMEIPEYAFDVHTYQGKRKGKTKRDFFREEHEALFRRVASEFDALIDETNGQKWM